MILSHFFVIEINGMQLLRINSTLFVEISELHSEVDIEHKIGEYEN